MVKTDDYFEILVMCLLFEIPIKVRKLVRSHGLAFKGGKIECSEIKR